MAFVRSSIGKKYLMGITGLIWAGFLLAHMLGNMLLFLGSEAYNNYSHKLITNPIILAAEVVLVVAVLIHIITAITLVLENKKAKQKLPSMISGGAKSAPVASSTMAIHGLFILAFLILHLLGFKYGPYYETTLADGAVVRDIFIVVVEAFKNPLYVGWYVLCLILLGLHLSHGVSSIFQSLGFLSYTNQETVKVIGIVFSVIVTFGFILQPIFVFFVF